MTGILVLGGIVAIVLGWVFTPLIPPRYVPGSTKSCPFCGETKAFQIENASDGTVNGPPEDTVCLQCLRCGARGPITRYAGDTQPGASREARVSWNIRA
jgi:hypothetical protein